MITFLKPIASLRLTVVLLALTMILVFAGTWAQIDQGIWQVQRRYFHSFFCWIDLQLFWKRPLAGESPIPGGFPMLGGYSLILLLLINLLTAHAIRFKFRWLDLLIPFELALILALAWPSIAYGYYILLAVIFVACIPLVLHATFLHNKRGGIILIHIGIILMIVGEVVTSLLAREGQMIIDEGQTVQYSQDIRTCELAVIDATAPDHDQVVAIPSARLVRQDTIAYPTLPFSVRVDRYWPNSDLFGPFQAQQMGIKPEVTATAGAGTNIVAVQRPHVSGTDGNTVDAPSAYITLLSGDQSLGTFLVSVNLDAVQTFDLGGKIYSLALRWKREYKPYSMTLLKFSHDKYTGTEVAKNFASQVHLVDPTRGEDREVKIWMNHPLRYEGETFYQASFKPGDKTTVLQVVANPGWLIPYVSCAVVTLGMLVHFGAHLLEFLRKNRNGFARAKPTSGQANGLGKSRQYQIKPVTGGILYPALITGACFVYLLAAGRPAPQDSKFDFNAFGRLPLSYEGRVLPLDTLARNSLRILSGKSSLRTDAGTRPAIEWLADVMGAPEKAEQHKVFRIDDKDLVSGIGLDPGRNRFTVTEVFSNPDKLNEQIRRAMAIEPKQRDRYQRAVAELYSHIDLFNRLADKRSLFAASPTSASDQWQTLGEAELASQKDPQHPNPGFATFAAMLDAYHGDRPELFDQAGAGYLSYLDTQIPAVANKASFEVLFNQFEPFIHAMTLYVLVFVMVFLSWLVPSWRLTMQRSAFCVLVLTLIFHTIGLIARIYIQGRPPVTNLYSSAIFIGWAAVVFCVALEKIYRNGVGSLAAAVVAFPSLLIAHNLAGSGDTMQMLQAVLDTNFWLATHVVLITLGYSATFLAGIIACVYVLGGVFTRSLAADDTRKSIYRMIYGVLCFAMLFSFVGTVLGGIWADQSWGRFWGWDPKENGAVLIVLWNAIVLHARWSGWARERGVANLAIFGNAVTSWSWFGTNMLGVGLHSYGFMDSALFWLCAFVLLQLTIIAIGNLPTNWWRSLRLRAQEMSTAKRNPSNAESALTSPI